MMMPRSAGHFFMYKDVLYTARAGAYEQCMYRMYGMPRAHGCAGAAMYRGMYGSKIVPYIYVQGSTVCRGRRTRSSDFDTSAIHGGRSRGRRTTYRDILVSREAGCWERLRRTLTWK